MQRIENEWKKTRRREEEEKFWKRRSGGSSEINRFREDLKKYRLGRMHKNRKTKNGTSWKMVGCQWLLLKSAGKERGKDCIATTTFGSGRCIWKASEFSKFPPVLLAFSAELCWIFRISHLIRLVWCLWRCTRQLATLKSSSTANRHPKLARFNFFFLKYLNFFSQNFLALCASDYYNGCTFHRWEGQLLYVVSSSVVHYSIIWRDFSIWQKVLTYRFPYCFIPTLNYSACSVI